jgi:hypothetical protein
MSKLPTTKITNCKLSRIAAAIGFLLVLLLIFSALSKVFRDPLPVEILRKHMEEVAISDGSILHPVFQDLDPLGRHIVSVRIPDSSVSTLDWLSTFNSLRYLDISGSPVHSLGGIPFANRLSHLNMAYTAVQNI